MGVITMPHIQDTTITNIPTITGIMGVMATVITRPLGLAMVTAEAIMAVVLAAFMAAGLEAAFTVATDKTAIFLSRISGYICDNGVRLEKSFQLFTLTASVFLAN